MCAKVTYNGQTYLPYNSMNIITNNGEINKVWGDFKLRIYNARLEKINSFWKSKERGILKVETFFEKNSEFSSPILENLYLCCLVDKNSFYIMTCPSSDLVFSSHHRMPVVISEKDINDFLNHKEVVTNNNFILKC